MELLTQPPGPISPAHQVRDLLRKMMERAELTTGELAQRANLTTDILNSAYFRSTRKTVHTEPDVALAVLRALCVGLPATLRCQAADAVQFLRLTQVPPDRYAEVRVYFPPNEWNLAVMGLVTQMVSASPDSKSFPPPIPHQLRAPTPHFVGRQKELLQLHYTLRADAAGQRAPFVLVSGMAGSGKTELALRVANDLGSRFPDAQLFIEIHGTRDHGRPPEDLLRQVIRAIQPDSLPTGDLATNLEYLTNLYRSLLAKRRALIILDDAFETRQILPLLPPVGSALLVTSRYRLALADAVVVELDQLAPDEAKKLFNGIYGRDAREADRIVDLCGYLPLAIAIAASTLKNDRTLKVHRYLSSLATAHERLKTLTCHDQAGRSVEAAIQLSVNRLTDAERAVFGQLAIFPDSFDLAAAQAVIITPGDAALEATLSRLFKGNLLLCNEYGDRYQFHDLVRDYALVHMGDALATRERHAAYYLDLARRCNQAFLQGGAPAQEAIDQFDAELPHLNMVWAWALGRQGERLALDCALAALEIGALRYHPRDEAIPRLKRALALADPVGDARERGLIWGALGKAWLSLGEIAEAEGCFTEQRRSAEDRGDQAQLAAALVGLGAAAYALGAIDAARQHYSDAHQIAEACGDRLIRSQALAGMARTARLGGELSVAQFAYQAQLALARESRDLQGEIVALNGLGNVALDLGQIAEARDHFTQQHHLARAIGDRHGQAEALGGLGYTDLARSHHNDARGHFVAQRKLAEETGDRRELADALAGLGHIAMAQRNPEVALTHYRRQLDLNRQTGDRREAGYALGGIGDALAALGDGAQAQEHYERWLASARQIGHRKGVALASWKLGKLLAHQGQRERGLALMDNRVAYKREIGHPLVGKLEEEVDDLSRQLEGVIDNFLTIGK